MKLNENGLLGVLEAWERERLEGEFFSLSCKRELGGRPHRPHCERHRGERARGSHTAVTRSPQCTSRDKSL